ncbi:MAG: hypothetical protein ABMA25_07560 [Ilumatobacteraceae bacterium]
MSSNAVYRVTILTSHMTEPLVLTYATKAAATRVESAVLAAAETRGTARVPYSVSAVPAPREEGTLVLDFANVTQTHVQLERSDGTGGQPGTVRR